MRSYDYLIVGGGVMGLTIAHHLLEKFPGKSICVLEKESDIAEHASGRNSGVLHAGFYYTADSLKARFTVSGNRAWRAFCKQHSLAIHECGKIVAATTSLEKEQLFELERRGKANGATVQLVSAQDAASLEPNVRTFECALWSPHTATVDPSACCQKLLELLQLRGVSILLNTSFQSSQLTAAGTINVKTNQGELEAGRVLNCAGLYADQIARRFGFGKNYTIIPFKGLYLKYSGNSLSLKRCVYPVPNLKNPFLGVHFTITVGGQIKIGPTAIPAFWRENYSGMRGFKVAELAEILFLEAKLFSLNSFGFRDLALEEMRKFSRQYMIKLAKNLVLNLDSAGFRDWSKPGIRAQLLDLRSNRLVQDFIVEGDEKSVHILNAVSPGFTCAFPFAEYIVDNFIK